MSEKEQHFKKRLDVLTDHLEKGGQGSGRKNLFDNSKKGAELARGMIKSTPERTQAYMAVLKNINLIEGYVPMLDEDVKKEFDGEIPDMMKAEDGRPPKEWWDACMKRAGSFADDARAYCGGLWHKPEAQGKGGEKKKESFGKAVEQSDEKSDSEKAKGWKHRFGQELSNCMKGLDGEALADAVLKCLAKTAEDDEIKKFAAAAAIPAIAQGVGQVAGGLGEAATDLFTPSGDDTARKSEETTKKAVEQKAVAIEPRKGTQASTDKRKPGVDYGGESEITGDPTKGNVADLKPSNQLMTN